MNLLFSRSEKKAREAIFYSYKRHINGFAANLEEEEATEIASNNILTLTLAGAGLPPYFRHLVVSKWGHN